MNGYYASVELLDRPDLVGKPMAVCGNPENRHGIILAKSEEAKKYGIQTAMTVWQAKKLCPELVLVSPHHHKYRYYSGVINEIYQRYTDMVEPFSVDESWLDVTHSQLLFGDGKTIADEIRHTVKEELGLTLSVGVSYNKVFAKMGSDYKKPDATTVITRQNYQKLLWPLPVGKMFFVGRATREKLALYGITTIGELAATDRDFLIRLMGKQGAMLSDYTNGRDDSPVTKSYEREKIKSVGNGVTFKRDLLGEDDVKTALLALSDQVTSRLRSYQMKAGGIKVDIKRPDLSVIFKQHKLTTPIQTQEEIFAMALFIVKETGFIAKPIRMLTLTGIDLLDEGDVEIQLNMFGLGEPYSLSTAGGPRGPVDKDEGASGSAISQRRETFTPTASSAEDSLAKQDKLEELAKTMDAIRGKYGAGSLNYARTMDNDIGIDLDMKFEEEINRDLD